MANTQLERLLLRHHVHEEDEREIRRIFEILTDDRKQEVLDHFETIVWHISVSRARMIEEQEILFMKAMNDIDDDLERYERDMIRVSTQTGLQKIQI